MVGSADATDESFPNLVNLTQNGKTWKFDLIITLLRHRTPFSLPMRGFGQDELKLD